MGQCRPNVHLMINKKFYNLIAVSNMTVMKVLSETGNNHATVRRKQFIMEVNTVRRRDGGEMQSVKTADTGALARFLKSIGNKKKKEVN